MTKAAADSDPVTGRGTIVALDQVTSSATNFVVVLVASRLLAPSDFGAFAISMSAFGIALGVLRTTSSERLLLDRSTVRTRTPLFPLSFLVVVISIEAVLLVLWMATSREGAAIWVVAAPIVLLQDRLRYVSLSRRPLLALASDAVWLVAALGGWFGARVDALGATTSMRIVLLAGPAVGLLIIGVGLRRHVSPAVEHDWVETLAESRFVLDSWILSSAVFVTLSGVAAVASLEIAGQVRLLFLIFQPYFSLAYVGRWLVLQSRMGARLDRWPAAITVGAVVYGTVAIGALQLLERLDLLPSVWRIGLAALVLNGIGQVARARHQGIVDLLRRSLQTGLVRSRLIFAVVIMIAAPTFARPWGITGAALGLALAFGAGAVAIERALDHS